MSGEGEELWLLLPHSLPIYEFDPVNRQITAARIYFDVTTLLKQISSHQPQVLQNLLIAWFASRAYPRSGSSSGYSCSH